ncbi:MAG: hypothetical protein U5M50_04650 [Sphingobium sp.]|nr:hypothetical protein [Sphingobium sp.]
MTENTRQVVSFAGRQMLRAAEKALEESKRVTVVLTKGRYAISAVQAVDGAAYVRAVLAHGAGDLLFDPAHLVAVLLSEDDGY